MNLGNSSKATITTTTTTADRDRERFATLDGGADAEERQIDRIGSEAYSFEGVNCSGCKDRQDEKVSNRRQGSC